MSGKTKLHYALDLDHLEENNSLGQTRNMQGHIVRERGGSPAAVRLRDPRLKRDPKKNRKCWRIARQSQLQKEALRTV